MKKIILASLVLFFGTSTVSAFDGVFLDQVQHKIFQNKKITISEAKLLLKLSSESPQKLKLVKQNIEIIEVVSSEDSSVQEIKEPVVTKTRRDFSFLVTPKEKSFVSLFEISNRNFSSSLELVRTRQRVAREKAMRYRRLFQMYS